MKTDCTTNANLARPSTMCVRAIVPLFDNEVRSTVTLKMTMADLAFPQPVAGMSQ